MHNKASESISLDKARATAVVRETIEAFEAKGIGTRTAEEKSEVEVRSPRDLCLATTETNAHGRSDNSSRGGTLATRRERQTSLYSSFSLSVFVSLALFVAQVIATNAIRHAGRTTVFSKYVCI